MSVVVTVGLSMLCTALSVSCSDGSRSSGIVSEGCSRLIDVVMFLLWGIKPHPST